MNMRAGWWCLAATALVLAACGDSKQTHRQLAGSAAAATSAQPARPGAVNVLAGSTPTTAAVTSGAAAPGTASGAGAGTAGAGAGAGTSGAGAGASGAGAGTSGAGAGTSGAGAGTSGAGAGTSGAGAGTSGAGAGTSGAGAGTSGAGTSGAGAAGAGAGAAGAGTATATSTQASLHGTIPPDPTTGFDGLLYFVGERLAPGSVMHVAVNGVPTKVLPAVFHSAETLGAYVYLTVAADYTFTAVAPDGTTSAPVQLTVPNGGPAALTGLNPPEVHMAFPPSLDTSFSGTVWLHGDQFMPGCVVTALQPGLPPYAVPAVYLNERTIGWVTATPLAGDVTLQVTNPTLMSSRTFTLTVGSPPAAGPGGAAPQVSHPGQVASPFVGTVHLVGAGILPGAWAELRDSTTGRAATTPLIRVSPNEAWWTLVYPQPGAYEVRFVNPGGAASPWTAFDVR